MGIKGPYFCGPDWWPQWLQKFLSQRFNGCCESHDADYSNPNKPRSTSDREFKECCLCAALRDKGWRALAYGYGWAVQALGWLSKRPRWWPF